MDSKLIGLFSFFFKSLRSVFLWIKMITLVQGSGTLDVMRHYVYKAAIFLEQFAHHPSTDLLLPDPGQLFHQ